ncbi:tRNA lysidine(34) synthetase TilS [Defluviitalea raffinosedens]|uniref:tRNA(Ile)-lysidine synthase n=2 Tax=Defluviitalea raffinosedens TaxID=1450156 RepID=A0A7C8HFQ0_9FIRM|nr:tRNA lysidine(34) synthetase TilS [Defluviitalea raffinosedens]
MGVPMLQRIYKIIKEYNMIQKDNNIIVGVSGGADSMCLLHLLKQVSRIVPFKITAVHINHGIRGKEAEEDAAYVRDICKAWDIPCFIYNIDVKKEALKRKCSEEEAGRAVRYEIFEKVREETHGDKIAVAHNMNDQAETVLMQLFRGSGMKGLGGITPVRDHIIRPLLEFTRDEIEQYCLENHIHYRQDYTNALNIYTRNKIRNELIPFIKKNFNPNIVKTLYNMSTLLREEESFLNDEANKHLKLCIKEEKAHLVILDNPLFCSYHPVLQKRIIRIVLERLRGQLKNIDLNHVLDVIELSRKGTGKKLCLPNDIIVKRQYEDLIFQAGEELFEGFCYDVSVPSTIFVKELNAKVEVIVLDKENFNLSHQNTCTKSFDYDKIETGLHIRTKQPGDRILLKNGTKKLKDFFIDEKIPRDERDRIPLLADGNKILWVIGYRYSDAYKITSSTEKVLQVRWIPLTKEEV